MVADDVVLWSARNAFLVLIVSLVVAGGYQFVTAGRVSAVVVAVWVAGAVAYYGSKYYYQYSDAVPDVE